MPVAVIQPNQQRQADPLEKLETALNIAKAGFGIVADMKAINEAKLKRAEEDKLRGLQIKKTEQDIAQGENEQKGIISGKDRVSALKDTVAAKEGEKGAYMIRSMGPDGKPTVEWVKNLTKGGGAGGAGGPGGKMIPASEAVAFGGAEASLEALDHALNSVNTNKDIVGPYQGYLSKAASIFEAGDTGKKAKDLDAQLLANAQTIGKYLEGGKLTDSDIQRYRKMMPSITDSPDSAAKKTENLKRLIANKQAAETAALKMAGYNTGALQSRPQQPSSPQKQISKEDQQAISWAKSNPNDPRAAEIFKLHGIANGIARK